MSLPGCMVDQSCDYLIHPLTVNDEVFLNNQRLVCQLYIYKWVTELIRCLPILLIINLTVVAAITRLTHRLIDWLIPWLSCFIGAVITRMADWLIGLLNNRMNLLHYRSCSIAFRLDWFIKWVNTFYTDLTGYSMTGSTDWLTDKPTNKESNWLAEQKTMWMHEHGWVITGWLAGSTDWLTDKRINKENNWPAERRTINISSTYKQCWQQADKLSE